MSEWIPYSDLDFSDEKYKWYNIDTRDFHGVQVEKEHDFTLKMPPNYTNNTDKYFFTPEEIKNLIERYYLESGGEGEWRMFSLKGEGKHYTGNWQLKYITIIRHKLGLIICSRPQGDNLQVLKKAILSYPVDQKYLHHQ